jgi:RNA polymerase sigma factor (sigma-70 family)
VISAATDSASARLIDVPTGVCTAEAYASHANRVRRTLRRLSHLWSPGGDDLEDVLHEVFLRVLSGIGPELNEPDELGHYLIRVATNLCIDVARKSRWRSARAQVLPSWFAQEPWTESDQGERHSELIRVCLQALPLELRKLYEIRFERGLSERQAARSLGVSRRADSKARGRALACHARKNLQLVFEKADPELHLGRFRIEVGVFSHRPV